MNIRLHIERLVFDGIDIPAQRRPFMLAAVESELVRLITEHRDGHEAPAPGNTPGQTGASGPRELSEQIARQVYDTLRRDVPWPAVRQFAASRPAALPSSVQEALSTPARPPEGKTRADMEAGFGRDLGEVRIHADAASARAVRELHARALTIGSDVLLGEDRGAASEARVLLAHELMHVVQQNVGRARTGGVEVTPPGSVYEREAETMGRGGMLNSPPLFTRTSTLQLAADKNPPGWDEIHNYKHPGNVTAGIAVFKTTGMTKDFTKRYIDTARTMLKDHGLGLDVYIHSTALEWTLPLQTIEQVLELRMLAHKAYQDSRPRLPVMFAPMHASVHSTGQTYTKTDWLPFVVINSEEESQDGVTLLHELGHAADVPGRVDAPVGKDDAVHNFMEYGDNRNDMHKQQVVAIARSYFAK